MAHGRSIRLVLSGDVVPHSMIGRCADDRQACRIVDATHVERLEGDEPLVVIHRQDGIEMREMAGSEETVGSVRTKRPDALLVGFLQGRHNDLLLFLT